MQSNICLIGVPEGEEKEEEIGTLSEKIMKENFHNLVKGIDMQVQEAEGPKQDGCKETQSETKDTLVEIKNNLQGNNSRVDEAKN